MLTLKPMKKRVIVFGAAGFVGSHIIRNLPDDVYQVIPLSRKDCDFSNASCRPVIESLVKDGDIAVCAAAKAPAKNLDMLVENIAIISNIAEALKRRQLSYVLNIGSDAIYADSMDKLDESSLIAPLSAHGIMHGMREYILEKTLKAPVGHLRPTLIYGEDDPHNGYGPNSFIRAAHANRKIELFGNGEEQRDHIFVGDVAKLAVAMIERKTNHAVNAVTGKTISFMEIAELIQKSGQGVEIHKKPRSGPMPHNGYRAFSNAGALAVCPGMQYQEMDDYIRERMSEKEYAL